ncbi:MAG: hypothetical protein PHF64_12125, partial [Methanoregula sp.]|nr:hypothetical protein [Methanoregula sp.]
GPCRATDRFSGDFAADNSFDYGTDHSGSTGDDEGGGVAVRCCGGDWTGGVGFGEEERGGGFVEGDSEEDNPVS